MDLLDELNNLKEGYGDWVVMLRNDGKAFNVSPIHLSLKLDNANKDWFWLVDEDFFTQGLGRSLAWYYNNSNNNSFKQDIIKLLGVIKDRVNKRWDYFKFNLSYYDFNIDVKSIELSDFDFMELYKNLCYESAQEFLKIRYEGEYRSNDETGDVYFRVASAGFNWFNIIWEYVMKYKHYIQYVNIVRDEELTGQFKYYNDGRNYFKHMPVEDFLTIKGNPVVESQNSNKYSKLVQGYSINESYGAGNTHNKNVFAFMAHKEEDKKYY